MQLDKANKKGIKIVYGNYIKDVPYIFLFQLESITSLK